ncbi:DUF3953 domain-containing protein [Bacillus mobilis]|uniref:DUF3953 domain-containing protein n=1 Tax=Bacillus mobilis TaxID=2026190 RepID=UPI003CE71EB6
MFKNIRIIIATIALILALFSFFANLFMLLPYVFILLSIMFILFGIDEVKERQKAKAFVYPALMGSKTPTSKFSESKEIRRGINCP